MPSTIRLATGDDAPAIAAIYAPVVRDTVISFELVPPDADEIRARMREVLKLAPWIVREDDGVVVGYAYASLFRTRAAYRFSIETTVYVHSDHHRRGIGRQLYGALLPALVRQGFRRAIAGVTLPNPGSVGLHEAMGFRPCGVFPKVGYKFGRWHDVGFWDLELAPPVDVPPEILPVAAG